VVRVPQDVTHASLAQKINTIPKNRQEYDDKRG
jgi:hypothetical protein